MAEPKRLCSKCLKNRQEKFFTSTRARVCDTCKKATSRKSGRKSHLSRTYGITQEEYAALKAHFNGLCWICRKPRSYNLQVDHSHIHEQIFDARSSIRGLLCKRCNKLLRDVGDDVDILRNAKDYLITGRIRAQEILSGKDRD